MSSELKPCPFCGSEAHVEKAKVRIHKGRVKGRRMVKTNLRYVIGCSDPDCILYCSKQQAKLLFTVDKFGLDTMIRRWNRRVSNEIQ